MKASLLSIAIAIILTGCSTKKTIPDVHYYTNATFINHMERCKNAGYLDYNKYLSGLRSTSYTMNTWVYDEQKLKDELDVVKGIWKDIRATEDWCNTIDETIVRKIAAVEEHKQSQMKIRAQNQQSWQNVANGLQEVGNSLQKVGQAYQEASNSINVTSPNNVTSPKSTTNWNGLPAPDGYQKTYVPSGSVGILRNTSFSSGTRVCEYSNGQALRVPLSQNCPTVLKP